jgi:uncharacterized protein
MNDKEKLGKTKRTSPAHRGNIKDTFLNYRKKLTDVFTGGSKKKTNAKNTLEINTASQQGKVAAQPRLKEGAFVSQARGPQKIVETSEKQKVEEAKYYLGAAPQHKGQEEFYFPPGYGDNKIVIMTRDPWWIFAYWEIAQPKEGEVRNQIAQKGLFPIKSILRVYDVTDKSFNGKNANTYFDIDLTGRANNWYINVGAPNRSWIVDIGILTNSDEFFVLARSNCVQTPRFGMSEIVDEEWMCQEDDYWKMFGLSGGFGIGKASLALKEMFKKRLMEQISSGGWSGSVSSISSPVKKRRLQKGFWLVVDCELIVYGQTEPNAKVNVQGKPLRLRKDGTFTLRFAFPDGKQEIPVVATSFDGDDTRTITPIVTRQTV